jgi:hypothetical protein
MKIRKLDTNGDIHFGYGDADFISDSAQTVAQKVVQRLRLWEGEWFLDVTAGTPWKARVLGRKYSKNIVQIIKQRIEETEGVQSVSSLDVSFEGNSRNLKINAHIMTEWGGAIVSVGNEPPSDVPTPTPPPPPPPDLLSGLTNYFSFDDSLKPTHSEIPSDTLNTSYSNIFYTEGKINKAIITSATNITNVKCSAADRDLFGAKDFSVSAWINVSALTTQNTPSAIFTFAKAKYGGNSTHAVWFAISKNWELGIYFGRPYQTLHSILVSEQNVLSSNAWHMVSVVSHADGTAEIYLDGVSIVSGDITDSGNVEFLPSPFSIWREGGITLMWTWAGMFDEVSYWADRALSAAEIQALWNNGDGLPFEDWT